jgi:hypothetical protein
VSRLGPAALIVALAAWPGAALARTAEPAALESPAARPPTADQAPPTVLSSIHYEDALVHAADDIEFTPGERVTIGFTPRADDTWLVGGERSRELPPGHVTGRQMRDAGQGSVWAAEPPPGVEATDPEPDAGVDAPIDGATGPSLAATNASASTTPAP